MSFIVTTTLTKPANSIWFRDANPEAANRLDAWFNTQPGLISASTQNVDENTMVHTEVFVDVNAAKALLESAKTNADWQAKSAFRQANNQQATTVTTTA